MATDQAIGLSLDIPQELKGAPMPTRPSPIDISGLMLQQSAVQGSRDALLIEGTTQYNKMQQAQRDAEAQAAVANEAQARINQELGKMKMETEQRRLAVVNSIAPDQLIIQLTQKANAQVNALEQEAQALDERLGVGLFDNPFEWIYNQFYLPAATAQYNAGVDNLDRTKAQISTLQSIASVQSKQVAETAQTTNAVVIGEQARLDAASAAVKIAQSRMELAKGSLPFLQLSESLIGKGFQEKLALYSAWAQSENNRIASESAAREAEKWNMQKPEIQKQIQANERFEAQLKVVSAQLGLPADKPIDRLTFEKYMTKDQQEFILGVMGNSAIGSSELTINASTTMSGLARWNFPMPTTEQRDMVKQLSELNTNTVRAYEAQGIKDPVVLANEANKKLQEKAKGDARAPEVVGSIYAPPSVATLGKYKSPDGMTVDSVPLWTKYFAEQSKLPGAQNLPLKAENVILAAEAEIKAKSMTLEQAAEQVAAIYNVVIARNNQVRNYQMFGLPVQQAFPVKLSVPGILFASESDPLQMQSPAAVQNILLRRYTRAATQEITEFP